MPDSSTPASPPLGWRWEHSYLELPPNLWTEIAPTPVAAPTPLLFNERLASELGIDSAALSDSRGAAIFSGNENPPGARPLAQAYAGHQFGHFTVLGDGRAILLGEQRTPSGELRDIQLKGSGPTPYSRRGDGRAALGPMLREHVIGEAMHALGIPTTRSLAVVGTGENVWRQEGALPGAVLTRVAASHLRVGTFVFAAAHRDAPALEALIDYTLRRHYPDVVAQDPPNRPLALLEAVSERQARLIAQWMSVGFVHGVMNTDNMALSGETIDYGPCAFLDRYDPATVFSSIDHHGRYAFGNQPAIALWNLTRFAETFLPLIHPEEKPAAELATAALDQFGDCYESHFLDLHRRKLGLFNAETDDLALVKDLLETMHQAKADFTNTFAQLDPENAPSDPAFTSWHQRWKGRLARQEQSASESAELRAASNPCVIPRNHIVEAALRDAVRGDLFGVRKLNAILARPFDVSGVPTNYLSPAPLDAPAYVTYCGT